MQALQEIVICKYQKDEGISDRTHEEGLKLASLSRISDGMNEENHNPNP
jgi:hypothetical protein